jgi:hypothetical protein
VGANISRVTFPPRNEITTFHVRELWEYDKNAQRLSYPQRAFPCTRWRPARLGRSGPHPGSIRSQLKDSFLPLCPPFLPAIYSMFILLPLHPKCLRNVLPLFPSKSPPACVRCSCWSHRDDGGSSPLVFLSSEARWRSPRDLRLHSQEAAAQPGVGCHGDSAPPRPPSGPLLLQDAMDLRRRRWDLGKPLPTPALIPVPAKVQCG